MLKLGSKQFKGTMCLGVQSRYLNSKADSVALKLRIRHSTCVELNVPHLILDGFKHETKIGAKQFDSATNVI
jgi:hypothetical protein